MIPSPKVVRIVTAWLTILLLALNASAAELTGRVVSIADGDTLTVLVDRKQVKVRLADIDAPERKQPYGTRSRQSLAELCHREQATVISRDKDRYGRVVGYVSCAGIDANAEQVRRGLAIVYERYANPGSPLYALQDAAKAERRGLWTDAKSVPPWEWRRR